MSELLVYPKNSSELKLIRDLMKRLNIKTLLLSEEQEDAALLNAMKEVDRTKFVSREAVMKKLKKK
ncbi:MAG: hypothetical protein JWO06_2149 [Bacteroidota bacterium]|nr:hypothetical protein [Bacteroidota bacterium]